MCDIISIENMNEKGIHKMKVHILNEMAMTRTEAISTCMDLGEKFIEHFHKVYNEGKTSENFNHHCAEMQSWLDKCRKIKLKSTNKYLTPVNLIDWFFTACGGVDEDNGFTNNVEIEIYNKFIIILSADNATKIKNVLQEIL